MRYILIDRFKIDDGGSCPIYLKCWVPVHKFKDGNLNFS